MAKDTNHAIKIDDVEYKVEDFSDTAKAIFEHVTDLEHKVRAAQKNLLQLQVGLNAFVGELKNELTKEKEEVTSTAQPEEA